MARHSPSAVQPHTLTTAYEFQHGTMVGCYTNDETDAI